MPVHSIATLNGQIEEFSCLLTDEQKKQNVAYAGNEILFINIKSKLGSEVTQRVKYCVNLVT